MGSGNEKRIGVRPEGITPISRCFLFSYQRLLNNRVSFGAVNVVAVNDVVAVLNGSDYFSCVSCYAFRISCFCLFVRAGYECYAEYNSESENYFFHVRKI